MDFEPNAKLAGVPVWGWAVVGFGVLYYVYSRRSSSGVSALLGGSSSNTPSPVSSTATQSVPQALPDTSGYAPSGTSYAPSSTTPTQTATKTSYIHYTILPGDTIGSLAKKFYGANTPVYRRKIRQANGFAPGSFPAVGTKIRISY